MRQARAAAAGEDGKDAFDDVVGDVAHALRHAAQAAEEGRFAVASMFAATAGQLADAGASRPLRAYHDDSPERLLPAACERLASAFGAIARRRELARLEKEIG